jgi:AcrR family transcriptional regulator
MAKVVDAEEKRAHIVAAAWQVVTTNGLDATTMRMIASAAGCTTGMVTHYFANKDEILITLVRQVSRLAEQRLSAAVNAAGPGVAGLRALIVESLPLDSERAAEWRVWLALWNKSLEGGPLSGEWARRDRRWIMLLRNGVDSAIESGDFSPDTNLDLEVETFSALAFGLAVEALVSPRRVSPATMAELIDEQLAVKRGQPAGLSAGSAAAAGLRPMV